MSTTTTVTTEADMEALPTGSVVLDSDGRAWQRGRQWLPAEAAESSLTSGEMVSEVGPLTVLHHPNTPQPAAGEADFEARAEAAYGAACASGVVDHIWLSAFACIRPTDEFLTDVGRSVVSKTMQARGRRVALTVNAS